MDWSFTEEQEELASLTRQILERELTEERMREIEARDDHFDDRLYDHLRTAGVTDAGSYGLIELCRVLVELGRAVAPIPLHATAVASMAVAKFGRATSNQLVTPALVEDLNPHVDRPMTTAKQDGDHWLLSGAKTTVVAGGIADAFLVSATAPEGPKVFIVPRAAEGVTVERQVVTDRSSESILMLEAARAETTLGGVEVIEWLARHLTVALCAVQLGVCERALELTAEYAKTREQFDRPIATFQAVGQRLADAYIDVNGIRLTLWQAAWRLSEELPCDVEIGTAKFWASDAAHRIAHTAVHVHGGMGIDLDYHLNRYFVAAKRIEFALGAATEQLVTIGRALADEPA